MHPCVFVYSKPEKTGCDLMGQKVSSQVSQGKSLHNVEGTKEAGDYFQCMVRGQWQVRDENEAVYSMISTALIYFLQWLPHEKSTQ